MLSVGQLNEGVVLDHISAGKAMDLYRYLKKKGFSDELMRDAGLVKFDEKKGPTDSFWNRVMVPIADQNGRVIGFGGRVLFPAPEYHNRRADCKHLERA